MLLVSMVFAGGGAWFNENFVKEKVGVPRPNIVWLAGDNGAGPLGMTPQEFYGSGDKEARSALLLPVLQGQPVPVGLSPMVEAHWLDETGYSFPSGHSSAALYFATFFLLTAVTYVKTKRLWVYYLLLPWAVAVCYSRPILRLHTPTDITVGALQGIVTGFVVWVIVRQLIRKIPQSAT